MADAKKRRSPQNKQNEGVSQGTGPPKCVTGQIQDKASIQMMENGGELCLPKTTEAAGVHGRWMDGRRQPYPAGERQPTSVGEWGAEGWRHRWAVRSVDSTH